MPTFEKKCAVCGKIFLAAVANKKYCSARCKIEAKRVRQRELMIAKRSEPKPETKQCLKGGKEKPKPKKSEKTTIKRKTKKSRLTFFKNYRKKILENDKRFNRKSRTLILGIDVYSPDFEERINEELNG